MRKLLLFLSALMLFGTPAKADYATGAALFQSGSYEAAAAALADSNEAKALYLLGYMYYHGMGVRQDYGKAKELFERSMTRGNREARTFLGYMYDEGKGVPQDKKRAFALYDESAKDGDPTAIVNLGVLYYLGQGVAQNYDKAFELLTSIKDERNAVLQYYLGNIYFYGFGTDKDVQKAVMYYLRAAQLGSVEAHYLLGHIYQTDYTLGASSEKALKYYEYAAMNNYAPAQYNLATMYTDGQVGAPDKIQAYVWLSEAVKNKIEQAGPALSELAATMSMKEIATAKTRIIELDRQLSKPEMISPSLSEDLGANSLLKAPDSTVVAAGSPGFTTGNAAPASTESAAPRRRARSPRMIRRR